MAHSGYPNYSTYSGHAQDDLSSQNRFGSARPNVPTSPYPDPAPYNAETRQAQYTAQGYSWPSQSSEIYTSSHANQGQYVGDHYRDDSNGQAYNYQREHTSHIKPNNAQAENGTYRNNTSNALKLVSTQALNELAYASGLETSGTQNATPIPSIEAPQTKRSPHNAALSQSRAKAVATQNQHTYSGEEMYAPYFHQDAYQRTHQQTQLILSAAAALQNVSNSLQAKPASPAQTSARINQNSAKQGSQSPYVASQNSVSHQRSQSFQSHNTQLASNISKVKSTSKQAIDSVESQQAYSAISNSMIAAVPQHINNIASLMTNEERPQITVFPLRAEQAKSSTTFVSPMDIWDPYSKEREKARRDATAAEAAAKEMVAEEASKIESARSPAGDVPQSKQANQVSAAQVAKPNPKKAVGSRTSPSDLDAETPEEAEMRRMMARMIEIRNKDPVMFQKVWDEEKKGPTTARARPPSAPPVTAQRALATPVQGSTPLAAAHTSPASRVPATSIGRGLNGYKVVIDNNEEGLPDLGKFPAERRYRNSYNVTRHQTPPAINLLQAVPLPSSTTMPNTLPQAQPLVFDVNATPDSIGSATQEDTPVSQPGTLRGKDSTLVWPEEMRKALAESAMKYLKADPRNDGLAISRPEIAEWLISTPSYLDLCHLFESRGFKLDRHSFAVSMLKDTPWLSKQGWQPPRSPEKSQSQVDRSASAVAPPVFSPPAANNSTGFPNRSIASFIKPETSSHLSSAKPFVQQQNTTLASHARSHLGVLTTYVHAPVPGSKEDNARKRNFDNLIDLSNDETEGYIVPEKRVRLGSDSPDPIATFTQSDYPPQSSFMQHGGARSQSMLPNNAAPLRFDTQVPGAYSEGLKVLKSSKVMLAKRLNKAEALRRNYYDPKTIARDILISSGYHLDEKPLNGHMAGLLGNHIELESDLSTFNWEDLDAGGPPAPKNAWTDIPSGPPRFKARKPASSSQSSIANTDLIAIDEQIVKPTSNASLVRPTRRNTHSTPSRGDVTTDPPRYNGRFGSGNYVRVQDSAEYSTRKWQTLKPSPLAINAKQRDCSPEAATRAADGLRNLAQQTKSLFNDSLKPPERRLPSILPAGAVLNHTNTPNSQALSLPKKRGPGRPRRDSNLTAPTSSTEPHKRKEPGRPPRSTSSPQVPITPARSPVSVRSSQRSESVDTSNMETNTQPGGKRKGRPPGSKVVNGKLVYGDSKPNIALEVVVPRKRPEDQLPEYPVFKCRWVKCSAELHNIATLRKHIAKLHKPAQEDIDDFGYVCFWKKCSLLNKNEDGTMEPTPIPSEEGWLKHINDEHIHQLGQKYGDGPSTQHIGKRDESFETVVSKYFHNPTSCPTDARTVSYTDPQAVASERQSYLADENGRTTTHLVHSDDEPDALILADLHSKDEEHNKAADMAMKSFMKNHGHNKLDVRAAADETLRAMKIRKEKIGVGIDRGGCTLINDDRRKTFVQNPGISGIVDYDY